VATHAILSPSPVWDASLQRTKIISHAMDAQAVADGVTVGLIAEPLVAADGDRFLQAVRLQVVGRERPVDPALVRIRLGGAEVPARGEAVGAGGLRLLVPEVDGPTELVVSIADPAVELTTVLQRPRHYDVHLVQHSHYDIGYTDRQHVVRAQHIDYLDAALRLMRDTDSLPDAARFRWNEEALYAVTEWLANRPAARHAELLDRVRENRISLSAMPFNLHTEMCSTDELHELLAPALDLKRRYGLDFRVAMQTDVPGQVIGLPDALAGLGVRYLSVAHNWAGRSDPDNAGQLTMPRLFRWIGPEGGELVVWRTDTPHGLAYMEGPMVGFHESYDVATDVFPAYLASLGTRPYPLPLGAIFGWLDGGADTDSRPPFGGDVLHLRTHGRWSDNAGPSRAVSDIVEEWNRRWVFPRLRVSTNEAFFDAAVERAGDSLPTYRGDWNDWWAHGVGAAAAPVGIGRQAQNDLADAATLGAGAALLAGAAAADSPVVDPDAGYHQLALWDEHTWGAANSWHHADHGADAGEHQWYWKVARAYEALDASDHALQLATGALGRALPRASHAAASLYVVNTTAARRDDEVEVFLPASIVGLTTRIVITDSRTQETLPHIERDEPAGSRGLGRYLRCRVADVGAVGFVRLDITTVDGERTDSTTRLPDPTLLQNEALTVRIDLQTGTLSSVVDRVSGRELVNSDAALGFNHYVYDRYATVGQSNHNSSKFADIGNLALISSRDVGGPAAVVAATEDARGQQVVLEQRVVGADWLRVTYRLPHDLAHLEITNRLSKSSTWDKESAYFAFPFAIDEPEVLQESAGGLTGSGQESVPGGAEYMRAIRHFVSLGDGDRAIGWATAEAPLVEVGTIGLPYVPFPSTLPVIEPATVYSWVHNNIWDTNFPVEQAFEMTFRYRVAAGTGHAPSVAARTASSLVQPLRAVLSETPGAEPPTDRSLLSLSDETVRLIGLRHLDDGSVVARLVSLDPAGATAELTLPDGTVEAWEATVLGEVVRPLEIVDGRATITFTGSGARAVGFRLG
jgi:hypothetical protein